jgi:hypothetical protein
MKASCGLEWVGVEQEQEMERRALIPFNPSGVKLPSVVLNKQTS